MNNDVNESLDGEELLSAKQKKLPDALKKSIIKRLKKSGKKEDKEEKDDDNDDDKKDKDKKDGCLRDRRSYLRVE